MSVTNGTSLNSMSYDQLKAELERVNGLLAAKPKAAIPQLQFKVGEKGGVCVIGLNSFPVTLYFEQWERLFAAIPRLKDFMAEHKSELKLKAE